MELTWIIAGALLGAAFLGLSATVGLHRDRGFYAALLIAIAFFYPVFSAERFAIDEAAIQAVIALIFLGVALAGYKSGGSAILSVGLMAHGTFDVAGLILGIHAPDLWAELCIGFDWVLALAARRYISRA